MGLAVDESAIDIEDDENAARSLDVLERGRRATSDARHSIASHVFCMWAGNGAVMVSRAPG